MNRIKEHIFLQCSPPLEVILSRLETRISILSHGDNSATMVYLKKDYEDLISCLKDKIII